LVALELPPATPATQTQGKFDIIHLMHVSAKANIGRKIAGPTPQPNVAWSDGRLLGKNKNEMLGTTKKGIGPILLLCQHLMI